MASNAPLPKAEAKIVVREFGTPYWRDSLDFDPALIPVESLDTTDVFHSIVIGMVNAVMEAEIDASGFSGAMPKYEYRIVWSETDHDVKGLCPVCDDVFPIAEGAPGDELNEGYDAVFCGCDPADN